MAITTNNILTLNHEEAMDFFMKSEQYHGFELPEYFTFDEVLKYVQIKIGVVPFEMLSYQPNSDYNQLWLQNMTYIQDKKNGTSPYSLRLCQLVAGEEFLPLWNNVWLNSELADNLPYESIVNKETLSKVTPVITFRETRAYYDLYYLSD